MEISVLPAHSLPVLHLYKGIVHRQQEDLWRQLQQQLREVKAHFAVVGLEVYVDEVEGYALLRQRPYTDEQQSWPKLSEERQLSYPVTLLCVLLRQRLLAVSTWRARHSAPLLLHGCSKLCARRRGTSPKGSLGATSDRSS